MTRIKSVFKAVIVSSFAMLLLLPTSVNAATNDDTYTDVDGIQKTVIETDTGTFIQGMVSAENEDGISPYLLANGQHTQYPSDGGTWTYGFWDVKVRSYYTVNKKHGSSVKFNGNLARSVDTASGKKSVAEKYAINLPGNDDAYYYRIVK